MVRKRPPLGMLLVVLPAAAWLIEPAPASAGAINWLGLGPYGGTVNCLAIDPSTPSTLYAGTGQGVFKSLDGGSQWYPINNGLNSHIDALAIDRQAPATVYAVAQVVYKSTNGGAQRDPIGSGLPAGSVNILAVDP